MGSFFSLIIIILYYHIDGYATRQIENTTEFFSLSFGASIIFFSLSFGASTKLFRTAHGETAIFLTNADGGTTVLNKMLFF
jgi:hypothetical protein